MGVTPIARGAHIPAIVSTITVANAVRTIARSQGDGRPEDIRNIDVEEVPEIETVEELQVIIQEATLKKETITFKQVAFMIITCMVCIALGIVAWLMCNKLITSVKIKSVMMYVTPAISTLLASTIMIQQSKKKNNDNVE